jgi:hypothetical protein
VNLLDFFPKEPEREKEVRPIADGTDIQKLGTGNGFKGTAKRTRIPIGVPSSIEGAAVTSAEQASTVIRGLLARWEDAELGEISAVFERLNGFVPLRNDTSPKRLDAKSWFEMLFRKMLEQGKRYVQQKVGREEEKRGSEVLKLKPWPDAERAGKDGHVAGAQRGGVQSGPEAVLALAHRFPAGSSEKNGAFKDSTGSVKAPGTRDGEGRANRGKKSVPSEGFGNVKKRKRDGEEASERRQKALRRGAATLKEQKGSQRMRKKLAEKIRRCGQQGFIPEHEGGLEILVNSKREKRESLQQGGLQEDAVPTSLEHPKGSQVEQKIEEELEDEDAEVLNEDDFLQFCLEEGVSEAQEHGRGFGGLDTTFLEGRDEHTGAPGEAGLKGAARESVDFCHLVDGELGEEAPLVEHNLVIPITSSFQTRPDAGDMNRIAPERELSGLKDEQELGSGRQEKTHANTSAQQTTDFKCEKRRSGGGLMALLYPEIGLAGEFLVAPESGDCEKEPKEKEEGVNGEREDGVHGHTGNEGEETGRKEQQVSRANSVGSRERGEFDLGNPSKLSPDVVLARGDNEGPVAAATAMERLTRGQKGSVEGGEECRPGDSEDAGGGESVGVGNEELDSGPRMTGGALQGKDPLEAGSQKETSPCPEKVASFPLEKRDELGAGKCTEPNTRSETGGSLLIGKEDSVGAGRCTETKCEGGGLEEEQKEDENERSDADWEVFNGGVCGSRERSGSPSRLKDVQKLKEEVSACIEEQRDDGKKRKARKERRPTFPLTRSAKNAKTEGSHSLTQQAGRASKSAGSNAEELEQKEKTGSSKEADPVSAHSKC